MKKNRMILSAAIIVAIVSGALAFKSPNLNCYACINNMCTLAHQGVDPNGTAFHYSKGAITSVNIAGQACTNRCDQPVTYGLE